MEAVRTTEVVIYEAREQGKPCAEGCGVDWLSEENQRLAQQLVSRNFGASVRLSFVNLSLPQERTRHREMVERVGKEGLVLPVLVINGEVRISGHFDFRMLRDMVEVAREVG